MSCKTILPKNIDKKLNTLDLVGCKRLEDINEQIKQIENFNNALKIDEKFLDLLKDEWGVDFWNEISELEKRKLIDKSKFYYKKIGTVYAIKEVLKIFDIDTKLKEWFDFNGEPYHFKVILTPITTEYKFDEVMFKKIVSLIDSVKNIRSVLDGFEFELVLNEKIKVYSGISFHSKISKNIKKDLKPTEKISTNAANVCHISINKNIKKNLKLNEKIYLHQANSFYLNLDKNIKKDLKPTENLTFIQGAISNVNINSTLKLNLKSKNNNNMQGVVIWQV